MTAIITDSSANLSDAFLKKYVISVISFLYSCDGNETASLPGELGAEKMKKYFAELKNGKIIKTSMINTGDYLTAFEEKLSRGLDVIYIGMSGGISGAYRASVLAAEELREKYPERKIAVINSRAASLGEGLAVIKAAQMRNKGAEFEEIEKKTNEFCNKICQYFTVTDLQYLKRSGRITGTAALIGTILNIRPVLKGNDDGQIVAHSKVRGNRQVLDYLAETYGEKCADFSETVAIAHSDAEEDTAYLEKKLREKGFSGKIITEFYEPVTGAHVGPGTVALFFIGEKR